MSDPEKTKAIVEVEAPKTLKELRRFMGMANQLGKFSPNLAECSQSLRELRTGGGIQEGERGADKTHCASTIQPKC